VGNSFSNPVALRDDQLAIDKAYVSKMLQHMGVDLQHPLAPSMIVGAFDVMASAELASRLPGDVNFEATLQGFHTFRHIQPAEVCSIQARVLDVVRRLCAPMSDERYTAIKGRIVPAVFPAVS